MHLRTHGNLRACMAMMVSSIVLSDDTCEVLLAC